MDNKAQDKELVELQLEGADGGKLELVIGNQVRKEPIKSGLNASLFYSPLAGPFIGLFTPAQLRSPPK